MTREEFARYLAVISDPPESLLGCAAVASFCIGSGARLGEALSLRYSDLLHADGSPKENVSRSIEKRRSGERLTVFFDWEIFGSAIRKFVRHQKERFGFRPGDIVFSGRWDNRPYSQGYLRRCQATLLTLAGLPRIGVGFHGLRKTFLRCMLEELKRTKGELAAARDCQRLAGHSRFDTTMLYLVSEEAGNYRQAIENAFSKGARNSNERKTMEERN